MPSNDEIIEGAKTWFRNVIVPNHEKNIKKLKHAKSFNINPFLSGYLANLVYGELNNKTLARTLVIPRIMSTSITTSFGQNIQSFISTALNAYGSTTSGIDIEFIDAIDGRKKYCQLKAGPETINKGGAETIHRHFQGIKNLARTNSLDVNITDLVVGVVYSEEKDVNAFYKELRDKNGYSLYVGKDFWYRLTGDEDFYSSLVMAIASVASESDGREIIEETIEALSNDAQITDLID